MKIALIASLLGALGGPAGVVIPYAGKLEQNGVPQTGTFDFDFWIMPDGTTGTPCQTRTVPGVAVTNGEFALSITSVNETCVKSRDVHLLVHVRPAGGGAFTILGKQRMVPTLSALTSGVGDFNSGAIVQGAFGSITNGLTAGSVSTGNIAATGTVTGANMTITSGGTFNLNPPSFTGLRDWDVRAQDDGKLMFVAFDAVVHNEVSFDSNLNSAQSIRSRRGMQASTTPDLAETIPAAGNVEAADVACADPAHAERVVRCPADGRGVLGVISDGTSSFLINSHANDADAPLTGAPLVLAGRVPVKVSLENGPIRIGDELTLSSVPGVAMRATGPGPVVGIALADFNTSNVRGRAPGTVLCFVKVAEMNAAGLARELAETKARLADLEARMSALEPKHAHAALSTQETP